VLWGKTQKKEARGGVEGNGIEKRKEQTNKQRMGRKRKRMNI